MPLYDFSCERGHRFEADVARDQHVTSCLVCGAPSGRLLSTPRFNGLPTRSAPLEPKSQRAVHIGEYEEASAQLQHEFDRYKDQTQQESLPEPDLWNPARRAADAVLAGKREPPKDWTPVDFTR